MSQALKSVHRRVTPATYPVFGDMGEGISFSELYVEVMRTGPGVTREGEFILSLADRLNSLGECVLPPPLGSTVGLHTLRTYR